MAPNVPRSTAIFSFLTACSNLALGHALEAIPSLTPTSVLDIVPTLLPGDLPSLPSLPDVPPIETVLPVDIPSLDVLDNVESILPPIELPSLDDLDSVESALPVGIPSLDDLGAVESILPVEIPSVGGLTDLGKIDGIKIPKRQATTTTVAPTSSTTIPAGWTYKYCATDRNIGTRALQTKLPNPGTFFFDNYSNEDCLQRCSDLGFRIAGTEYGGECHCGNQVNEDSHQAPESECNKTCYANNAEICGGDLRLSLYAKAGARLPPSSVVGQCLYPECFTTTTTAASSTTGAPATSTTSGLSTRSPVTSLTSDQISTTSTTTTNSVTTTSSVTSTLTSTTTQSVSSTATPTSATTSVPITSGPATTTTGSKVGETPVTNYEPAVTPLTDDSQYAANDAKVMTNNRNGLYQYQIFNNGAVDGTDLPIPDEYADRQINTMLECTDLCNYINQQNGGTVVCEAVVYDGPDLCYPLTDTYQSDIDGRFSYYYAGSIAAMALRSPSYPRPTEGPTDPNAVSVPPTTPITTTTTATPVSTTGGIGTGSLTSTSGDGATTSSDPSSSTSGTSTRTSRVTLSVVTVYPTNGIGQRTVNVYISYCPTPTPTLLSNEDAKRWVRIGRAKIEKR